MMSRWPHRAEGVLDFTGDHQVDRLHPGPCRAQRRLPGVSVHRRVRIEVHDAQLGRGALESFQMPGGMHAMQLLQGRQGGVVIDKIRIEPLRNQVIADRGEALRSFRMIGTHVVQLAVAVGDEGSGGHCFLSVADARQQGLGNPREIELSADGLLSS
jgi:hypothetical protein